MQAKGIINVTCSRLRYRMRALTYFLPQQAGAAVGTGARLQQPPPTPSAEDGPSAATRRCPLSQPASQPAQPARRLLSTPLQQQHLPLPAPQVPWAPPPLPPAGPPSPSPSSSSLLSPQHAHLKKVEGQRTAIFIQSQMT